MSKALDTTSIRLSRPRFSIHGIRKLLFAVLSIAIVGFTIAVSLLVQQIFENFGPSVQQDLDWKTVRGAQELARACDLGLAVGDENLVRQAFGDYRAVKDVMAIVAVNSEDAPVAFHRRIPESLSALFQGPPATIRRTPGYLVAWASASVEGNPVGKVAVVIDTRRLVESEAQLRQISYGTAIAGGLALFFGMLFVNFFTRAIIKRDSQLAAYAAMLEQKVAERTVELDRRNQGMRLVLDNVTQGFITVGLDGVMAPERSSIVGKWFGTAPEGTCFSDYIRPRDKTTADWFTIGLEAIVEDVLPASLLLTQLPQRLTSGTQIWSIAYTPILSQPDGKIERLLLVLSDITEELIRDQIERDSREMVRIFQRMSSDRGGAEQFFAEATGMVERIAAGGLPREVEARLIHTLKGNCALFGIESMAKTCHEIESCLAAENRGTVGTERKQILDRWGHIVDLTKSIVGERRPMVELEDGDIQELGRALQARAPHDQLMAIVESWRREPVSLRFARLAEKAVFLSRRLGRQVVTVHSESNGIRLDAQRWAHFWAALVHAVNNAVDHGIEDEETRLAQGKSAAGSIWLNASTIGADLMISVCDDGRGIDWDQLAKKGAERGMAVATRADIIEVMCADGVSTAKATSTTSGRGVGLAALREATHSLGGEIEVESEPGKGTTFVFCFRGHGAASSNVPARRKA
jgi:HPt (histidine-containing phosphotransfer) domain-containing protein